MKFFYLLRSKRISLLKSARGILTLMCIPIFGLVHAQSITVTTTVDENNGNTGSIALLQGTPGGAGISLREAIIASNNEPNGASIIITIPAGTYNLSLFTAGETSSAYNAASGDLDILAATVAATSKTITINGAGAASTIINQTVAGERVIEVHAGSGAAFPGSITFTINGVTLSGGNPSGSSGGAILAGRPGDITNVTNCILSNNISTNSGGALSVSSGSASHNLTVTGCTFSNNTSNGSGAAISFNGNGTSIVLIDQNKFINNTSTASNGGAINISGTSPGPNVCNITRNTFTGNTADLGGSCINAINVVTINVNYNRIVGNNSIAASGKMILGSGGVIGTFNTDNNWWGVNTGPSAADITGSTPANWLQLKTTANPTQLCTGGVSTITTGFLLNSVNSAISVSNLTPEIIGLPVTFTAVLGSLSAAQPSIQANGTATVTFTAGGSNGAGSVNAQVDNVPPLDPVAKAIISISSPTVVNPGTTSGTVNVPFNQTFTMTGGAGSGTFTTSSTLPTGLSLATNGTLSGTPTQRGTFPIVVNVTDANSCSTAGPTYNLVINCQTITVTNPGVSTGTNGTPFTQNFTQSGSLNGSTFTLNSGTLPNGLTLSTDGVLSGTPSAPPANYPITVKVTDGNGCTGISPTYNLVISCQTITVTNPTTTTGQVNVPFNQSFTQTGGVGTTTFSTASTLPNGLTLSGDGVLSGTPTQSGTFPIVVTATDANGCTGTGPTYNLVINTCPVITVTNPATTTGTAGTAFSQTFTSSGGAGTPTYSTGSTLPTGLTLSPSGVLSGTPTQPGTFPITVTATDANNCTGTGSTYNLVINCPAPITATATPSSQTKCSGVAISTIVISSGGPAGTVYNWTRDNPVSVTGIAASGSGNIAGTLVNTTSGPITVTFTITPSYYGTCTGNPTTATVLVNPTPTAVATPSSQTICSASAITTIVLSGNAVPGVVYNWTRDNTISVTGIAASGSGNISGSLTNTTNSTVTVTFTITPTANGCAGTPITATVQVNPTPAANATPSSQTICSGGSITTIVLSGSPVAGTVYNWTRDNTVAVTGIAASGSGNISGLLTNSTNAPVTVTFTITPTANSCPGTPITSTVTVNPTPNASASPSSQTSCSGSAITTIVLSGTVSGTVFNWSRNNTGTATGIAASGSGNISGSLTNTTNAPVTVTFTITPNFTNAGTSCGGATITATVTVNPLPTVTCPGNITTTATPGQCGAVVNYPVATASGTPTPTISYSKASGSFFPIGTTVVTVTASNSCGTVTCTFNVVVTGTTVTIPPVFAVNPGGIANTIYKTYGPQSLNLTAVANGGASPYNYSWSGPFTVGATNSSTVNVMPPTPGTYTYTVVVSSNDGCVTSASTAVKVYNISCGGNKISLCQTATTTTICIGPGWVPAYLSNGYMLGACNTISSAGLGVEEDYPIDNTGIVQGGQTSGRDIFEILVAPNPSTNEFGLIINSSAPENINVRIMDAAGRVLQVINNASKGSVIHVGNNLRSGTYFAEAVQGKNMKVVKLVKIN